VPKKDDNDMYRTVCFQSVVKVQILLETKNGLTSPLYILILNVIEQRYL